jgi:hypothetical protein
MAKKKYDTSNRDKNRKKLEQFLAIRNGSNNIKPNSSKPK